MNSAVAGRPAVKGSRPHQIWLHRFASFHSTQWQSCATPLNQRVMTDH